MKRYTLIEKILEKKIDNVCTPSDLKENEKSKDKLNLNENKCNQDLRGEANSPILLNKDSLMSIDYAD